MSDLETLNMLGYLENRPQLINNDCSLDLNTMDEADFRSRYRVNKSTVETVIEMLSSKLDSNIQRIGVVTTAEKVSSALRFYAEGCFLKTVRDLSKISQASSFRAINEVSKCLAELGKSIMKFPSEIEVNEIIQNFRMYSGFPGVLGILDCSHIPIVSPGGAEAEQFRCRKGYFSLNVQTLCDDKLQICNIVASWPGGTHDITIFDSSRLRTVLESTLSSNCHVLGDSGYPLRQYLLTPFLSPSNVAESRYNTAHIKTRNSVERQYGVWKSRFSCLSKKLRGSICNTQNIIIATAVLHNIALDLGDNFQGGFLPVFDPELSINEGSIAGIAKRNLIVLEFFSY